MNYGPYRIPLFICSSTLLVFVQNLTSLLTATKSSFVFIPDRVLHASFLECECSERIDIPMSSSRTRMVRTFQKVQQGGFWIVQFSEVLIL